MSTTVAPPPADQAADVLQKMSLDSKSSALEIPEPTNKAAVYKYEALDSNAQVPSFTRPLSPLIPSDAIDPSVCYVPSRYQPYFYGGYGNTYTSYINSESPHLTSDASLVYPHGYYGYAPYPYSPATSPSPQVGAQQYQYPPYFAPTSSNGSFASTISASTLSTNKAVNVKTLSAESNNSASSGASINVSAPVKPLNQSALNTTSHMYGNSALGGGIAAGYQHPGSWQDAYNFSDVRRSVPISGVASSYSKADNNVPVSRNQNYRSNSDCMMTGYAAQAYYNREYQMKSGMGYGSSGYYSRTNEREWTTKDNKYRSRGKGDNYSYGNENLDGLNELNRGPRATGAKNQKETLEASLEEVKEQTGDKSNILTGTEKTVTCVVPDREECSREDFPVEYKDAKFFIIKSYSEDDVHKSIKYNVWASTPNGNKKLDAAYEEAQQKSGGCPVFLFFSVNASGQFVGLAEMIGPVDFNKNVGCWQQDKWTGSFPLKWHIVKDVPNSLLKHIKLENNENKPVTNSRDTQEVKLEQGLKVVKIFKEHKSKTCILDDFLFYEVRQKTILEKKAKQQQSQKQVWEGKTNDEKTETLVTCDLAKESGSATLPTVESFK
ncbi:YTH domain-containing protein ECT4 [Cardamine amara subsp. amara]|uniref:YTH domain-containing family protein n=1 Tax=Cardamine amara subsp. amara TaxID=228776 RepID=A0ABD0ZVF5_CARAN